MDKEEALAREWCKQNGYVMMPEAVYESDMTKAYFEGQNIEPCEDAISRADAISLFKDDVAAVNELMQLESVQPKVCECEDAISRQAVLDLIYNSWKHNGVGENYGELSIDVLKALPPVTPKQETVTEFADRCRECGSMIGRQMKQKMGRWIREKKHHKDDFQEFDYWDVRCSECGARKRIGWMGVKYCPNCGAKMEGGAND